MGKRKGLPKDNHMGRIPGSKDCLKDGKLKGEINWKQPLAGHFESKPFRFAIEKVEEDKYTVAHWKMIDSEDLASYHAKTAKELKDKAQEIIDVESGKIPPPKVKKKKAPPKFEYEGLFVGDKKVWPKDDHKKCGACMGQGGFVGVPCESCGGSGLEKVEPEPPKKRTGLFD